jgi:diketogulonate reductase-like aldo/keto reductase
MRRQRFGALDHAVPVIGQGTWQIDGGDRAAAIAALRAGLDLGMTHIDTAEMYGGAEELVAEAIEGRRDEVFLVSKVVPSNASRDGTVRACERSLARLRTDRLECYLLHWPGSHRLEDTVAAFEKLIQNGKILSWGVSNFDVDRLAQLARISGPGRIACNQVLYHIQERAIEHAVLPWCAAQGVAVVGYSPFGQGYFPVSGSAGGRALAAVAAAHNATPRQVALSFLVRHPGLFTIPKASRPDHATENAGGGRVCLSTTDIETLERAFPLGRTPRHLPML